MFQDLINYWWQFLLLAIGCYLFASINYSVIFSKLLKKEDVREHGSKNAGTTNMFRVYGLLMGALTFVCDCLKGVICCLVAKAIWGSFAPESAIFAGYFAGFFAVVGHIFPVYYKLKGGKGYATTIGIGFAMQPVLTACMIIPILLMIILIDRMSIVALTSVLFFVVWHWVFYLNGLVFNIVVGLESCIMLTLGYILLVIAHRQNIVRIFTGKELPTGVRKALFKKKDKQEIKEEQQTTDKSIEENTDDTN